MGNSGEFLKNVSISDMFWSRLRETVRREGIPYQWEVLNDRVPDAEPSYCMRNFRAAAGKEDAPFGGFVFQDSDFAKWLEGVSYSLTWHPDAELEQIADAGIEEVIAAQQPDGYLDTYFILNGLDKRWTDITNKHELYVAGHMIEAAVAYYQATGKRRLLDAMLKLVDHIDAVIGPEEGKLRAYPGHPVLEMALVRLWSVTGDEKHLRMAEYFIRERGRSPLFFEQEIREHNLRYYWKDTPLGMQYYQAHQPLTEQKDAVGHAVRALYLYAGLADVARLKQDKELLEATYRLWNSVTKKRMYITGAVGSSELAEAFTYDYDLPNDTVYGETCAAIALVFLAQRMLQLEAKGEYGDVMERALYNGVISGMELDGKKFFYVNPLEVVPEACRLDPDKVHVKPQRQKWFGCACCPPNVIRLLTSLHHYIYSVQDDTIFAHLYVQGEAEACVKGAKVLLSTRTNYPWDGRVTMTVGTEKPCRMTLALRIPGWSDGFELRVNGEACAFVLRDGYVYITRQWQDGDQAELALPMEAKVYQAHPMVREDAGKVAVMRGPLVYCLEEIDNGDHLHLVTLKDDAAFIAEHHPELLGGVTVLKTTAWKEKDCWEESGLYSVSSRRPAEEKPLTFVPYYAWANRGEGEMTVWIRKG